MVFSEKPATAFRDRALETRRPLALPIGTRPHARDIRDLLFDEYHDLIVGLHQIDRRRAGLRDVPLCIDEDFEAIALGIAKVG